MIVSNRSIIQAHDCGHCGERFIPAVGPGGVIDATCPKCGVIPNLFPED